MSDDTGMMSLGRKRSIDFGTSMEDLALGRLTFSNGREDRKYGQSDACQYALKIWNVILKASMKSSTSSARCGRGFCFRLPCKWTVKCWENSIANLSSLLGPQQQNEHNYEYHMNITGS